MFSKTNGASADADDEFYIGYASAKPIGVSRFVSKVVVAIGCVTTAVAIGVAGGHRPLAGGVFEFGHPLSFVGTIVEHPYPALMSDGAGGERVMLVAQGKHGAAPLTAGLDGRHVSLRATRILRDGRVMLEVEPVSIVPDSREPISRQVMTESQRVSTRVQGEVVDTKCFMGVMVPGDGKTHRDCAALCLRGGIPPALSVTDADGGMSMMLIAGADGQAVGPEMSEFAGDTVDVSGDVNDGDGWPVLHLQSITRH
ncbi:MAG: hypothetical protein U0Q11_17145 [Vicinamibacterales bacterium]